MNEGEACVMSSPMWSIFAQRDIGQKSTRETKPSAETSRAVQIVEQTNRVEKQAFSSLLKRHQDRILRTALHILRNRTDAFDILQEVSFIMYRSFQELDTSNNIEGWIYHVTVNECYRWLRKHAKTSTHGDMSAFEDLFVEEARQEGELRTQQFQSFLKGAMEILSEQERVAFVLRDLEQLPGKEIADVMGCQPVTARGYYFAARKKLAKHIRLVGAEWLSVIGGGAA